MVFKNIYFPFLEVDKDNDDFVIDCKEGIYDLNWCEYLDSNNRVLYYGVIITKSSGKKTDPIKFMTRDHK